MRYYIEESLSNFEFWSGAKELAKHLTDEQFDVVEQMLEDSEPAEGWSDTAINDFFWFEGDTIAEWLGYENEESLVNDITIEDSSSAQEWFEGLDEEEWADIVGKTDKYTHTDEDGNEEFDFDSAREDMDKWWDKMSSCERFDAFLENS